MSNILNGISCLVLGAIVWVLTSVVDGFLAAFGESSLALEYLMYMGFFIMTLGPIIFWIAILP
ncbi:MAG: hypothetical protein PHY36_01175 [Methanocellales archaeon]|nr:hypothetical protein [Methanocellales archaeon]